MASILTELRVHQDTFACGIKTFLSDLTVGGAARDAPSASMIKARQRWTPKHLLLVSDGQKLTGVPRLGTLGNHQALPTY